MGEANGEKDPDGRCYPEDRRREGPREHYVARLWAVIPSLFSLQKANVKAFYIFNFTTQFLLAF